MFTVLNLQPEIFSIDINDLSLKILKLKKKRKGFIVTSFNEASIPVGIIKEGIIQNTDALAKIIREACRAVKGRALGTSLVAISLPEEKSFSQVIKMPRMTEEELRMAVPFEVENYIPLPLNNAYLDFQVISGKKHDTQLELLVNAMPKPIIDSYVLSLKKAGLTPYILETESQAIVRALVQQGESLPPTIFIDFGETKTNFIIFSGKSIRFTSSSNISSQQITAAIQKSLGVSSLEAENIKIRYGVTKEGEKKYKTQKTVKPILTELASQVTKYIHFYQNHISQQSLSSEDSTIGKVIICGGGSNLKDLPSFLHTELTIPIEIGDPLINIQNKKEIPSLFPSKRILSFTTALGLALRASTEIV